MSADNGASVTSAPMELDMFACERLIKCKWQCFALHQGVGRGRLGGQLSAWQETHAKFCGGRLVSLKAVEVQHD